MPETKYLEDLIGIEYDLLKTVEWCNRFDDLENEMFWLVEPLTTSILIFLSRAFGGGVRSKHANTLLSSLTDEQATKYQHFIDLRNKHIAHSVSEFEENQVKGYYIVEKIENGIYSIGEGSSRVIGLSKNDTRDIRDICVLLLEKIKNEKLIEKEKILNMASKYPPDYINELSSSPFLSIKKTSEIDIKKRRK